MLQRKASWRIVVLVFWIALSLRIPLAHSTRPIINSVWVDSPPKIDGIFTQGEWANPQIVFEVPPYPATFLNTYVYFANDNTKLYVMVDAVGDKSDDRLDEALLIFGFTSHTTVAFRGTGGSECRSPATNCQIPQGVHAVIGCGTSPNSIHMHKIYEVSIPLKYLGEVGQSVDFSSPKANVFPTCQGKGGCMTVSPQVPPGGSLGYDDSTRQDNVWPQQLQISKIDSWGILVLASSAQPVPENVEFTLPVCLMLVGAALVIVGRRQLEQAPTRRHHTQTRELLGTRVEP